MDKMVNSLIKGCTRLLARVPAMLLSQVCQADGEVIITNDGATILNKMTVTQPAAKMLVELAKSQVRLSETLSQKHCLADSVIVHTLHLITGCGGRRWYHVCHSNMWSPSQEVS